MFFASVPYQITPDLYDKIAQGGVVLAIVVFAFLFLMLFVKVVFGPQVEAISLNLTASRAGFETIMKSSEAQTKTLELYAGKLQAALDREEEVTAKLRSDLLQAQSDVVRLETQLKEQQRLRELDFTRIKELERGQSQDKEAIDSLQRELGRKNQQITALTDELAIVKRERQEASDQRDEQVKIVDNLKRQLDALTSVVNIHEAAIKGDMR